MGCLRLGSGKATTTLILGLLLLQLSSIDIESQASAQRLPADEVSGVRIKMTLLKTISSKMNNTYWTITEDSCSKAEWNWSIYMDDIISNVTCNCSFSGGDVCHVTNFAVKGFNLSGIVPDEFGDLTYLQELDLTRNYLNGTIPKGLGKLQNLQKLALLGNRINGSIPDEIANISSLVQLILEDNQLTGPLPENIGNMTNLKRVLLSANNFTGPLPNTFGKLKGLTDFRIDGNQLSGSIPNFIGNWTNLTRLDWQGTSMQGPIPSSLSLLTNMIEMRITDLSGPSSSFPDLSGMTKLERLALRNCRINGTIPDVFGSMSNLKSLDLSNNQLTGEVPSQLQNLYYLQYLFLNNNSLTGEVPGWIQNNKHNIDVSYNNFTGSIQSTCQQSTVNLVSSHSESSSSNSVSWCLMEDLPCSKKAQYTSLFINCGGSRMPADNNEYQEDLSPGGPSNFAAVSEKWAYTSTGTYLANDDANFITGNLFNLTVNGSDLYKSARLAPQSLNYFGLCLLKGSYQVKLHFAEIMYSNDHSFSSLGKRMFDVAIQGNVVLKDFNIAEEAGGVGIGIEREFTTYVNGSTLQIHLYWLGKGTNAIPDRGVYGPLISAITVTPNFKVDTGGLSTGAIAGIVISSIFVVVMILLALRKAGYLGGKDEEDKDLRVSELHGLDLQTGHFTLRQIKKATNNFDPANKIGEGGFGPVYKGELSDGAVIAVKQLSAKSKQGNREFVNEIGMISALQHHNLVRLFGCCIEGNQLLLVYEYLENNSLARALFGREEQRLHLDWSTRKKILLGIAKGLAYLHEESRLKIVHRDIKATNVLLDKDLNAKISDFGLAKLNEDENTHISTRIAGTIGYMAPEYAMRGYLTDKADVYSFGIVALEIVSGKSNTNYRPKEEFIYLLDWAYVLQEQGNLLELVDPVLGSDYSKTEAMKMLNLAIMCTNPSPSLRPRMTSVVKMLEGKIPIQTPLVKRMSVEDEARFKAFEILSQDSQTNVSAASNRNSMFQRSMSLGGPWADSSDVSFQSKDESSFLEQRTTSKMLPKDLYDIDLK